MQLYLYPSTIIQFRTDGHYTGQCTLVLLAYLHHFTAPQYNNTRYVCFWNVLEYHLRIEWVTRSTQLIFILLENRNCMSNTGSGGWQVVVYLQHGTVSSVTSHWKSARCCHLLLLHANYYDNDSSNCVLHWLVDRWTGMNRWRRSAASLRAIIIASFLLSTPASRPLDWLTITGLWCWQ